jgi:hypothetical protein
VHCEWTLNNFYCIETGEKRAGLVSGFRLKSIGARTPTGAPEPDLLVRYETSMFAGQVSPKHCIFSGCCFRSNPSLLQRELGVVAADAPKRLTPLPLHTVSLGTNGRQ